LALAEEYSQEEIEALLDKYGGWDYIRNIKFNKEQLKVLRLVETGLRIFE
jgi:hypothetical protein|tara:strand:- start:23362 stop:23511 length:150 start_codon:yes stop_codon:yes gene_type:complete